MAIIKHNKLIETSYKLNSREQFFVLYLISQISQNDSQFREYTMHYSEIEKIINFDGKRRIANKNEVFTLMDKLNSVPIIYEKGSIVGKSVWLQHMEHDTETDEFTFSISEKLKEYLVQLKEHFTRYNISNIIYLNSNAIRLYEVLKRHQFKGECVITLEKLKFYLGIENRYPKFYEFKRWVLLPSQTEIEKYTDIRFEFRPHKKDKKKILSLKFYIYENEPQYTPEMIRVLNGLESGRIGEAKLSTNSRANQKYLDNLTESQGKAFRYLSSKGVNKSFIVNDILSHPKVNYAPLKSYEDVYIELLWKFFSNKTKSQQKAGAFVNWWKNGKLTEDSLHARLVELVLAHRKENESSNSFSPYALSNQIGRGKTEIFSLEQFKMNNPGIFKKIQEEVRQGYTKALEDAQQDVDLSKYQKSIDNQVYHKCKAWAQQATV